jgi:hypothetical protein
MKIRHIKVNNSRLTEGRNYPFKILKFIELDDEPLFVMQDPLGYKALMPKKYYHHYGFQINQIVDCRVDKINCNGKMFLEPMHPIYKEREIYDFKVLDKGSKKNIIDEYDYFILIKDSLDQRWSVKVTSVKHFPDSDIIQCKVDRIKKGSLYLSIVHENPSFNLQVGNNSEFVVIGEKKGNSLEQSYFILQDHNGEKYPLLKKYYNHYGIQLGQILNCTSQGYTSEGYIFLEPDNPWYKTGNTYTFEVIELNKLDYSDGTTEDVLILQDPHGEEIKTFINAEKLKEIQQSNQVRARLRKIRKSRLELEII